MVKPKGGSGSSADGDTFAEGYGVWLDKKAEGHCSKFCFYTET